MKTTAFAIAASLFAAPALAEAPPPLARHVCPNGLEVIVAERHATPLVTIEVAVHNGAMNEPPEYSGVSHLFEHMFFKANHVMPDQVAYLARRRELGISGDATTSNERVNYFDTTTSDHFEGTMAFMRDAITGPLFDPKELERERVVVTGEIDRNESSPDYYLWHETTRHLFAKYPTRKDPLGSRKTVLTATPEMMRTILARWYVPNNSVLVVVGDVKADDVFKMADAQYAEWKRAPDPFVAHPVPTPPPLARSEVVVVQHPVETFKAQVVWQGPSTIGPTVDDTYAADLVATLVGDPGSRFQRDLVDSGRCVHASLGWDTQRHVGPITLEIEAADAKVDDCVRGALAELAKIEEPGYFTDEDRANAAHRIAMDQATQRERTQDYAHMITFCWANATLEYYATYLDRVRAVKPSDVSCYLHAYLLGKPFVLGALVPPKLAANGIDRRHLESLAGIAGGAR